MALPAHFEALVFDLDGVIIDTERSLHLVWTSIFEEFDCHFSRSEWHTLIGTSDGESPYSWLERRARKQLPKSDDLKTLVKRREMEAVELLGPMPGVVEWITAAREARLALGVASSSSRSWVEARLSQVGLLDSFSAVLCRDEVHSAKPSPDLYLAACATLGVLPDRSIAIEDSRNGVIAALTAGLTCIAVPNAVTVDMDLSAAHHHIASLADSSLEEVLEVLRTTKGSY